MHYIDTPTAIAGQFVDPAPGQPPTVVDAAWANMVQNEFGNVLGHVGIPPSKGNNTQLLQALLQLLGPSPTQGKNPLINPGFHVAQRGDGPFAFTAGPGPEKLFDGWWFSRGGTGAITAQRRKFAPDFQGIPGNPKYWLDWQATSPGTSTFRCSTRIEDVRTFQGMVVTVSGYVLNQSPGPAPVTITPRIVQTFGAGGSADVITAMTPIDASSAEWQFFATTVELPTLVGKVVGSGGDDYLAVGFEIPGAVAFAVGVANLQIESGNVATAFDESPAAVALLKCMRYREATQTGLPITIPPGLEEPNPRSGALYTFGKGYDFDALGTSWYLPALQRAWIVPKRLGAVTDSAQRIFSWYSAQESGGTDKVDINGTARVVLVTAGMSEFFTGYPSTATNPGGSAVEFSAHYSFDDLVI